MKPATKILGTLVTLATLVAFASPASAAVIETDIMKIQGGRADFGSGIHAFGAPNRAGTITWSQQAQGDVLLVRAKVEGILYMDSLDPGHARLEVQFRDCNGQVIATRFRNVTGGGGNANLADNQLSVSVTFESPALYSVRVRTWEVLPNGTLVGGQSSVSNILLERTYRPNINNGTADFGNGFHAFGAPTERAHVSIARLGGLMHGFVTGTLYWDSLLSDGCARIVINFEDENGTNLATRVRNECGHTGNANDGSSQETFAESFEHPALHQIQLRVGSVAGGDFVNTVSNRYVFER